MSDLSRVTRIIKAYEDELAGEGDLHGAALLSTLAERIESELTEEADTEYECSCEEDPDLCPFHGAPL